MAKFMKKAVEIEAVQFKDWSSALNIFRWADNVFFVPTGYEESYRKKSEFDAGGNGHVRDNAPPYLLVKTLEGVMRADQGDWIIKGIQGEFYPCKPDIFKDSYDEVED